jgi:hypothetical protein
LVFGSVLEDKLDDKGILSVEGALSFWEPTAVRELGVKSERPGLGAECLLLGFLARGHRFGCLAFRDSWKGCGLFPAQISW